MKRTWVVALFFLLLVGSPTPSPAQAGPITFNFGFTSTAPCEHWYGCVPSFNFSFDLPNYVTTSGVFALLSPISFNTGLPPWATVPVIQNFPNAGTNNSGVWIFGNGVGIGDGGWGGSYMSGPILVLDAPSVPGYITAPTGTPLTFRASGYTMAPPGVGEPYQYSFQGTGSLSVTVTPEPVTMILLGTGLLGVGAAARRRRQERDAEG